MNKLPLVSAHRLVKFFENNGFVVDRQKGSHIVLTKPHIARPLVIPNKTQLLEVIIIKNLKSAGISVDDFINAMSHKRQQKRTK